MALSYQNVLVAVDGSEESKKAFEKAVDVAKRYDANLFITHVVDTTNYTTIEIYHKDYRKSIQEYAEEITGTLADEAKQAGIKNVEVIIETGSPKTKISKEIAPKHNIDVIICGATGLNAVERLFIGSVSEHITRYAKCDVIVVRN